MFWCGGDEWSVGGNPSAASGREKWDHPLYLKNLHENKNASRAAFSQSGATAVCDFTVVLVHNFNRHTNTSA